jgi:F420-non-reducing hydrogenase iron-sulfur subunit
MTGNGFEPKIVGFLCNWCSYQGADMAGTARMQYAPNVHIIRVNCSGRVDPDFGIEPGRFRLEWVSAAEGAKWARMVNEMTEQVRRLGPLNWKEQISGQPLPEPQPHMANV